MSTTKAPAPRTAAEINARLSEIGAQLARNKPFVVPNWRELAKEQEQLKAEYLEALARESARPSEETMRQAREQDERQARLAKAIADAAR